MLTTVLAIGAASWGLFMAVSPVLQIRKMVQQQSSRDVSLGYFAVLTIGFALWLAYGLARNDLALVIPNSVALVVSIVTIAIARRYRTGTPEGAAEGGPSGRA